MIEDAFRKITSEIKTKEDLIFFIEEIDSLKKNIFKDTNSPLSKKILSETNEKFINFLLALEKEKLIPSHLDEQLSFFEQLRSKLERLPQIKLEIAFRPSDEFVLKIKKWLENETKRNIILDIISNPNIVGGATIEYRGRYLNFSLAKEIEKIFSKNNEPF